MSRSDIPILLDPVPEAKIVFCKISKNQVFDPEFEATDCTSLKSRIDVKNYAFYSQK